jgi:hypothetical protein
LFSRRETGLLRKRRWARALTQACGWIAAGSTLMGVAVMIPLAGGSDAAPRFILIIACCAMFGFGVVLPVAVALFLGSRSARMTCERYDPVPRWTDGLPVLTLVLTTFVFWTGLTTLAVVIGPPGPLFGTFLPPIATRGISAAISISWLGLGAGLAARKEAAWWGTLAFSIVVGISNVLNAVRVPMEEIYRRAGMTPVQISQVTSLTGSWPALLIVPSIAFVVLVLAERALRNRAAQSPTAASAASR